MAHVRRRVIGLLAVVATLAQPGCASVRATHAGVRHALRAPRTAVASASVSASAAGDRGADDGRRAARLDAGDAATTSGKGPRGSTMVTDFYGRSRSSSSSDADADEDGRHRSVVKIFTVTSRPNYELPWQSHPPESSTGSGLAISEGGKRLILTNAHVVADATLIEVRKSGSARRFVARAYAVAHECDLALLAIDDAEFWRGIGALELGGVPHLRDSVVVVGYPEGGDSLCVTSGVVSRIELQVYEHSGAHLLSLQIDAAINPGNSGGPAFDSQGRVVGVAFQNAPESQSIGYVIPTPVIRHFLKDVEELNGGSGRYTGFPAIGVICQHTENPQLRERLGLPKQGGGILVRGVHPLAAAAAADTLRANDVLLSISNVEIASDGTCEVNPQERVAFAHLVQMKFPGETCEMEVLRDGALRTLAVPALRLERLVAEGSLSAPSFFVYGGLVFMPLTMGFLHEYGHDWYEDAPRELVELWEHGQVSELGEQAVLLSRVLAAKETVGYSMLAEKRVLAVDGEGVRNFRHFFSQMRRAARSGAAFVELTLFSPGGNAVLVLKHASADAVDETIRRTYRIPHLISDDLLDLLEPAGARGGEAAGEAAAGAEAGAADGAARKLAPSGRSAAGRKGGKARRRAA